jgi:hypothetical protein
MGIVRGERVAANRRTSAVILKRPLSPLPTFDDPKDDTIAFAWEAV